MMYYTKQAIRLLQAAFLQVYMVELYNDQLLDLFDKSHSTKLDIKKDKKGLVLHLLRFTL